MHRFLVVGLGNPGYNSTVHNLGALLVENHIKELEVIKKSDLFINKNIPYLYYTSSVSVMNVSGEKINFLMKYNNISHLVVLYDDIRVAMGKYKLLYGGSHSGHNGIKSIINYRDNNFLKVAIGAGPKPPFMDLSDYVLSKISSENLLKVFNLQSSMWQDIYGEIYKTIKPE